MHTTDDRLVRIWILTICFFIFAMIIVGGITRLTESGLSIVEWKPVAGAVPPLSDQDWHEAFDQYKKFPQFEKMNSEMTLSDFKYIFFWEFTHRLLGRLIGLIFFIPFIFFILKKKLSGPQIKMLSIAFILGGMQGLLGWYMVKSGLVNMPRVSHYRLAAHMGLAVFLMAYLYWVFLNFRPQHHYQGPRKPNWVKGTSIFLTGLICLQIIYGAFTAGLRAGYVYNTFPTMNGLWIPEGLMYLVPAWKNFFENHTAVQFIHRSIAWVILFSFAMIWIGTLKMKLHRASRRAINLFGVVVIGQFTLGVLTLVYVIPIGLASAHQAGACLLLLTSVYLNHSLNHGD